MILEKKREAGLKEINRLKASPSQNSAENNCLVALKEIKVDLDDFYKAFINSLQWLNAPHQIIDIEKKLNDLLSKAEDILDIYS